MWAHMFFVSSILNSNDAIRTITKMFERYFFFERQHPEIVSAVVAGVFILFIAHAGLAVCKMPRTTACRRSAARTGSAPVMF
jgi:fumarate reductase subunit C